MRAFQFLVVSLMAVVGASAFGSLSQQESRESVSVTATHAFVMEANAAGEQFPICAIGLAGRSDLVPPFMKAAEYSEVISDLPECHAQQLQAVAWVANHSALPMIANNGPAMVVDCLLAGAVMGVMSLGQQTNSAIADGLVAGVGLGTGTYLGARFIHSWPAGLALPRAVRSGVVGFVCGAFGSTIVYSLKQVTAEQQ